MSKIIFFPSFSAGSSALTLRQNGDILPNVTSRFYNKDFFKEYYLPYFLLTAGHLYKESNAIENFGLTDNKEILTMGDSGGHQIATGVLKWSTDLREKIFNWLETNSDISMIIDIPPGFKGHKKTRNHFKSFEQCRDITIENAEYIYKNKSGSTKYLNVLQGKDYNETINWYEHIKDIPFYG